MNIDCLSDDAQTLLKLLSKRYQQQRKAGFTKFDSCALGSSEQIHRELVPAEPYSVVDDLCGELYHAGFLDGFRADGHWYSLCLTDDAVAYFESNRRAVGKAIFSTLCELLKYVLPWKSQ